MPTKIHDIKVPPIEYRLQEAGRRRYTSNATDSVRVGDWLHFREHDAGIPTGRHLAVRVLAHEPTPGGMMLTIDEPEFVDGSSIHWTQTCGCVWASSTTHGDVSWSTIVQCPTHARAIYSRPVEA